MFEVTSEFKRAVRNHHPQRTLDVARARGRIDLIKRADEFAGDVLFVGVREFVGPELHGFGLAVVAVVDHQHAARRAIHDDAVGAADVLIEIEGGTHEQQHDE
ncbi:MAG: hypothetical protein HONDAALG_01683 [Gammaproteobacteria bacterium]|nr:hypothetical protein [Gammaproteobacteria bacterium]